MEKKLSKLERQGKELKRQEQKGKEWKEKESGKGNKRWTKVKDEKRKRKGRVEAMAFYYQLINFHILHFVFYFSSSS